jgi:hypothetical protein
VDTVLEIGPGTGNLTVKMLEKCKKVRFWSFLFHQSSAYAPALLVGSWWRAKSIRD